MKTSVFSIQSYTKRQYIGDAIIDDGKLTMQLFEGGYLDAAGNAYYYITDWQGNITAVADAAGNLVQSTGYYPDGEPWEEPQGDNRFLFAGKERVGIGGLNMYDFGPRMYNAAACFWYQPDPAAASYPHISPYYYCAGNPVRFVDPSGMVIVYKGSNEDKEYSAELISKLRDHKIFDIVFSTIDASQDIYTIGWGKVTLPDNETPADACFDPNNNSITLSNELRERPGAETLSISEELYHVYQKIVDASGWGYSSMLSKRHDVLSDLFINKEYEAKNFAAIVNIWAGWGCSATDIRQIRGTISTSFMNKDNTKFVYNSNFPSSYVEGGQKFLDTHKDSSIRAYKVPINFMPNRLFNLLFIYH